VALAESAFVVASRQDPVVAPPVVVSDQVAQVFGTYS
jgi:hypothetical protein